MLMASLYPLTADGCPAKNSPAKNNRVYGVLLSRKMLKLHTLKILTFEKYQAYLKLKINPLETYQNL